MQTKDDNELRIKKLDTFHDEEIGRIKKRHREDLHDDVTRLKTNNNEELSRLEEIHHDEMRKLKILFNNITKTLNLYNSGNLTRTLP